MESEIVRFNLSGNRIFKNDDTPIIIIEDTGSCMEDFKSEEDYDKSEEYFYEHPTSLRDICVLLYKGCGQGVQ